MLRSRPFARIWATTSYPSRAAVGEAHHYYRTQLRHTADGHLCFSVRRSCRRHQFGRTLRASLHSCVLLHRRVMKRYYYARVRWNALAS